MILLKVDPGSPAPLYQQIIDGLVTLIGDGTLLVGSRVPATRVLARQLGVNRTTVYRAYQELWARGYLESRPGAYSTVRQRPPVAMRGSTNVTRLIDWDRAASFGSRAAFTNLARYGRPNATAKRDGAINFCDLSADRGLCPVDDLRRAIGHVMREQGSSILGYGDPAGYLPLRETIARRLRGHGIAVDADEVMITSGSQHAIELVLQLLTEPGDPIVVESPTYGAAIPLCRLHQIELVEVPMAASGMDLDALERELAIHRPKLVYTVPNFQNPTGITTDQGHRERLLALCESHRVPLVEDGFEEEMKYFGRAVLPIKSMDTKGGVIYLGTFSKVIFPGLRIGWISADSDCIRRLTAITRFAALSGSGLVQAAMARFIEQGSYETYLRRLHRAYRTRMHLLLRALHTHMPTHGVRWTEPAGGYTLWVSLEGAPVSEVDLVRILAEHGVLVVPGSLFYPNPPSQVAFRLSIANLAAAEIVEGARRLGQALAEVVRA